MYPENRLLMLLLVACASATAKVNKTQLYFSYITIKTGDQFITSGGAPAVDLALEEINRNSSILANYTLNYTTVLDSKVSLLTKRLPCNIMSICCYIPSSLMHGPYIACAVQKLVSPGRLFPALQEHLAGNVRLAAVLWLLQSNYFRGRSQPLLEHRSCKFSLSFRIACMHAWAHWHANRTQFLQARDCDTNSESQSIIYIYIYVTIVSPYSRRDVSFPTRQT